MSLKIILLFALFIASCNDLSSVKIQGIKEYVMLEPIQELVDSQTEEISYHIDSRKLSQKEFFAARILLDSLGKTYHFTNDSIIFISKKSFLTSSDYISLYLDIKKLANDNRQIWNYK